MRKNLALFLVALVALTLVVAAYGCGSKPAENTSTEATSTEAPADTGIMEPYIAISIVSRASNQHEAMG